MSAEHALLHEVPRLSGATIHVNPAGGGHHDAPAHHRGHEWSDVE